jgi:glycine cleavage system T protein (aminomethyltransferase)
MTEFAGFEMPLSYSGIIDEHRAVRSCAGLFDLSHMGEFEVTGPRALELLEQALTNSAKRLREGRAHYTIMCAEDGGTIDDLIVYRLGPERYMLCVNAANAGTDRQWLLDLNRGRAEFRDVSGDTALVAVQGPKAQALLQPITEVQLEQLAAFAIAMGDVAGLECAIARTGYTGEDGFELFARADRGGQLFEAILEAGAKEGLKPCGLGARDTLRLEAGLPLYGHELDRGTSALEAGLDSFVKFGRGFIGEPALRAQLELGLAKRLIGLRTDDGRTIARQGYKVYCDGRQVGAVTSGTFAPSFDRPLAMGYITDRALIESPGQLKGRSVEIEVRNRRTAATLLALPFYRRGMMLAA